MPLDAGTTNVNPTAVIADQTQIQKQENNRGTVTSGPYRLAEIVTCRLRAGKQTRTHESATPEQLECTAEALQQAKQEGI